MKHGKIFGNKNDDLKGLGNQMDWAMADMYRWIGLGLNKRGFIIFVRAPDVFYWNKHISSDKCKH